MKPSICKELNLSISIPEKCDARDWLTPVENIDEIENLDRNHAYITPDKKVYVLNKEGTGLAVLEENILEKILQNGMELDMVNKSVNIEVPTKTSELINDSFYVSDDSYIHTDNNYTTKEKNKLSEIPEDANANIIEEIKVNDSMQRISDKSVNIDLKGYEEKSNKVNDINNTSDVNQYASAKAVYEYVQSSLESISGSLKIPISLDKESDLPNISTLVPGDYFVVQEMDITAPEHTGRIWINYNVEKELEAYKVID